MAKKKLFIFAPFGTFEVHHQLDVVLSLRLRMQGYEVYAILCDRLFSACDVLAWSGEGSDAHCSNCAHRSKLLFSQYDVPIIQMSAFLSPEKLDAIDRWVEGLDESEYLSATYKGADIGAWVVSSVFSMFRITSSQLDDPKVRKVHKEFLRNGAKTHDALNEILDIHGPSNACVFNGRFAPYRIALEMCKARGIPVVVHERGWADGTFITFKDQMAIETAPVFECADAWKDVPVNAAEVERVSRFFANREQGNDINITPFVTYTTEHSKARVQLRIPPSVPMLVLFTTSEYELELCDDFKAGISQLELIRVLFDIFKNKDAALVVRHHPYIGGDQDSPPDRHFLSGAYDLARQAPENVRVIMPGEKLSSYALFWSATGCIAPFSMTGVEAVARGVKSIGFEQSPLRPGLSGTFPDFSRETISRVVDELLDPTNRVGVEDLRKLYRFQSSFISRLCASYKTFGIKDLYMPDIKINDAAHLAEGYDPALDRLCSHIIRGTPLFEQPDVSRIGADPSEETLLLQAQLKSIEAKREQVSVASHERFSRFSPFSVRIVHALSPRLDEQWITSVKRGRHQHVQFSAAPELTPESVLEKLSHVSEPFCVIRSADVLWYDEAFLSRGLDQFAEDRDVKFGGIVLGGWFVDERRKISHGIYTNHYPTDTVADVFKACGENRAWHQLTNTVLFNTNAARVLMEKLAGIKDEAERFVYTFCFLAQAPFKHAREGLVLAEQRPV